MNARSAERVPYALPFSLVHTGENRLNAGMNTQTRPANHDAPTPPESFDALLVAVGRDRDRAAFIRLFHHFAPRLKSFLMKNGTPGDQAEEWVQDAMLSIWTKAESFDPAQSSAATWIFTIARNKKIDALRKTGRIGFDQNDPAFVPDTASPAPDAHVIAAERSAKIADALRTLPPEQAEVLRKSFFEDKTHMEIARETTLPLGTVKSRIRHALERLSRVLGQEEL